MPYHGYMTVFPRGGFFKEILREYYGKFSGQTKTFMTSLRQEYWNPKT